MANPLTGDFEAVLQVSGATVNRLLASMHQNAGLKPDLPSFPHAVRLKIGDPDPISGLRGWITGQVSTPRIDLIHGVSDRFWLEVSVRARYKADPGTVPIPEFIHGTVRAQYRIEAIDPGCWGWEKIAADYIWVRVVSDTVSFTGTAEDDVSLISIAPALIDPSVADARITEIARHLLSKRFEATPHKVSRRFRRGAMRSLNIGPNKSLVAVPIGLSGDPSAGQISSINQDVLEGRDVGIAINRDVIIAKIQEALDQIRSSFRTVFRFYHRSGLDLGSWGDLDVITVTIDWTVTLKTATAQWIGGIPPMMGVSLPGGLVSIAITGEARTQKKIFNFDFNVTQMMLITFDGATEQFAAAPFGTATVNLTGAFGSIVESEARPHIQTEIANAMKSAASGMGSELSLTNRKDELVKQLKTMDDGADVDFTNAVFTADGVIVRGNIPLSPRRAPVQGFAFTADKDGYSSFESWIPGGRVDSYIWSWKWFNNAGKPGSATVSDRWVLRRPPASGQGKFGAMLGLKSPLPGLDGMGQVCLVVHGSHVHHVTGEMVPVYSSRRCKRFGFDVRLATPDRLFLREWTPGPRDPIGPVAEGAIHEVNTRKTSGHGANTLVVRAGDGWNREAATSLRDGLADSRRRDAGLVVLVLFNDGQLMQAQPQQLEEMRALAAELEAPLVVNEDVEGSWSKALRIEERDTIEWRLVTPTGGVTWAHSGELRSHDLAEALDNYLFRSPVADISMLNEGLPLGTRISPFAFESDVVGRWSAMEDRCPPPPFHRHGIESAVKFIKRGSLAAEAAVREMGTRSARDESEALRIIVVDGGTEEDVERLRQSSEDVMILADPDGNISRQFGIRSWPSSVRINESGAISEFKTVEDEVRHE